MLIALCLTSVLLRDGQTSTQMPQPVQSSGATCRLYIMPASEGVSLREYGTALNVAGARCISSGRNAVIRIAACGQTSGQIAHCVQIVSSQIGISWAMLRFSHCVVPVGNVPSTGIADTGSRSPLPSSIIAVTRWTKSGAAFGTIGRRVNVESARPGTLTSAIAASEASTAAKLRASTVSPRLP